MIILQTIIEFDELYFELIRYNTKYYCKRLLKRVYILMQTIKLNIDSFFCRSKFFFSQLDNTTIISYYSKRNIIHYLLTWANKTDTLHGS